MMSRTFLKFKMLFDLAAYVKLAKPNAYIIDTTRLTLLAYLTEVQIAIAIEEFQAVHLPLSSIV